MGVFSTAFAHLFRAVDRVRSQLETADPGLRPFLAQELHELRQLSEQYIDKWMELEEQILELMETYQLKAGQAHTLPPDADTNPLFMNIYDIYPEPAGTSEEPPSIEAESGDIDLAEAVFSWPEEVTNEFRKGLAYYDLYMFEPARKALEDVLHNTNSAVVHLYLAAVMAAQGKARPAREHLQHVLTGGGDSAITTAGLEIEAQLLLREGKLEEARKLYATITTHMPEYLDAWYNLGLCDAKLGFYAESEDAFAHVLNGDPGDVDACLMLASVQQQNRRLGVAYQTCRYALDKSPSHPGIRLLQSRLLYQMGRVERSLEVALRLADEDVHDQRVLSWTVWLLLKTEQNEPAVLRLKRFLSLHRNHPTVLLQLGVAHLLMDEPSRAEPVLWAALPGARDKSMLWLALGAVSASGGRHQEAQKRFLRATRDTRSAVRRLALYQYAVSLQALGKFEEAEKYLHAAHVCGPPSAAILSALANSAQRLGRTKEAEKRRVQADNLAAVSRQPDIGKHDEL